MPRAWRREIAAGRIDGCYLPGEWRRARPPGRRGDDGDRHRDRDRDEVGPGGPGGPLATRYRAGPGGVLFFRPGAYRRYGYRDEAEFARDVHDRAVAAKTVAGALSLGEARRADQRRTAVSVFVPGQPVRLVFWARDEREAREMTGFLRRTFPAARVDATRGRWAFWRAALPPSLRSWDGWRDQWRRLAPETRRELGLLGWFGLVPPLLTAGWLAGEPFWPVPLAGLAFVGLSAVTTGRTARAGRGRGRGRRRGPAASRGGRQPAADPLRPDAEAV